jgi:hypothetical protein
MIDRAFIILNLGIVCAVAWVNFGEARNGFRQWRRIRWWAFSFALVYACSYLILLTGVVDRLAWSKIMIGVSPAVWVAVWLAPAWKSRQVRGRIVTEGIAHIDATRRAA